MKTRFAKKTDIEYKWYLVDAKDAVLGRLAVKIAVCLRGKNKAIFTPNVDTGDFVVVVNAEKVRTTGKKLDDKIYYHHSGYPGGIKAKTLRERLSKEPQKVISDAVWGMLPKNRLGRAMLKKLKVYKGSEHPHVAQKPEILQYKEF
ncbi:MAG: 50S ribosomal protein L13 [Nitrospirae bacterium RIFOXYB2_FULL_43_5]|nr:MAG: 50S ribosomal protein L13 [Nitrospirae bacterium GWF2_44_13]OGW35509.1 MAG: 50S ribosomal protein L13 [Nitrospirae bacterium GWD2_44_7]OGW66130.1 MAG: 50S ribosomal protein L13 [Nitrospirae bacterium RIFOXYA2_FULL_44_9]OGW72005.1 MAG: 50S ribosomal protein L13 [Nitrospirae bacterium RIFCSPHIGHO2_02_FULL_40_19]OGW72901.1 MAG: 50S ribosomal protein L13 [Nitrospirae bacterium RIFOXYB2_FULL_43_5]OGW74249.1 MAG: 50S ribosomal protein L13 [Nitrospirae bacterium RIFOXYC2_FULL_44_7]HBG92080.1